MKNLIPIFFFLFLLPATTYAQFCCCIGCGDTCISMGTDANCAAACFFSCTVPTPFESSGDAACLGTACNPIMPIELAEFNLRTSGNTIILSWSTANELNNQGFEVQRISGLNMSWETLAFVRGAGTTTSTEYYEFEDETAPPGINYYRLKQIDFDETSSISSVKTARLKEDSKYTVWPTLARNQVLIKVNGDHRHNKDEQIHVFNMMGKIMYQGTFDDGLSLDVSSYPAGSFIVNLSSYGKKETFRFMKVE